jgi:hypothetical protein
VPTFTENDARARVFVWRQGVAKAVGHDVEIDVRRFTVDVDVAAQKIHAVFQAGSLAVLGAVKRGQTDPDALSSSDKATIDAAVKNDILQAGRFPEITFTSTRIAHVRVEGNLTLRGVTKPIAFDAIPGGGSYSTEVVLDQTAFGIKPYTAFMGALKVKPNVLVRLTVPLGLTS